MMNKMAERAHIESEDVAAVKVLKTGARDMRARKINMDDLTALRSVYGSMGDIKPEQQTNIRDIGVGWGTCGQKVAKGDILRRSMQPTSRLGCQGQLNGL